MDDHNGQRCAISRGRGDVRILNIFEGTAKILSRIIARGLVAGRN